MSLTLLIANKAYSSWSLRPYILMRHFGIAFDEITIALGQETTRADILKYSPSARCPALIDGDLVIWDSLSIIEYVAEKFPNLPVWPRDRAARAVARSLAAEMHSGFQPLRVHLPMNMRRAVKRRDLTPEVSGGYCAPRNSMVRCARKVWRRRRLFVRRFLCGRRDVRACGEPALYLRCTRSAPRAGPIWMRSWRCLPIRIGAKVLRRRLGASPNTRKSKAPDGLIRRN